MQDVAYAVAVLLYAVASGLHWDHIRRQAGACGRTAWLLTIVALGLHLLGLIHLVVEQGAGGLASLRALPVEIAFVLALAGVVLGARATLKVGGTFLAPVAMVLLAAMLVHETTAEPALAPSPATAAGHAPSPVHVAASALGFLSFCLSYGVAALFVLKDGRLRGHRGAFGRLKLPPLQTLERLMYRILLTGFVLFTLGAALGMVQAVGQRGLGFQPKYTLAALSWLCFALVLGLRWLTGWTGRRAAFLVALGFVANLAVVMTYYARLA